MFKNIGINKFNDIDDINTLGRVVGQYRDLYKIYTNDGEIIATLSGSNYHKSNKSDFPVVGDWVKYERYNKDSNAIINKVCDRKTVLSRKQAGKKEEEQLIAANIDIIFIVTSLNHDFNPRRLERYLTIAWDSGAKPIIILNKSDLSNDIDKYIKEVEEIAFNTPYIVSSCVNQSGLDEIKDKIKPDKTAVLIGSSGVGKSSIINYLLDNEKQNVQTIREDDDKGRHTTTNRELFIIPSGGVIIDTPGMREIQLWVNKDSLGQVFNEIESLAKNCKFNDCSHTHEPGCAVKKAIEDNNLSKERLENYFKMQREIEYQKLKEKYSANRAEKIKWDRLFNQ